MIVRRVDTEVLDGLAASDPRAQRARGDLQRMHRVLGTRSTLLHALRGWAPWRRYAPPWRVLELGAGDGSLMLGVAEALSPAWAPVELTLLDRAPAVAAPTLRHYADLGWRVRVDRADALTWAGAVNRSGRPQWDLIVANLFLHHFEPAPLAALLHAVALSGERFLACEPRRSRLALTASHLVGALGANAVTRTDAVRSVHAGFRAAELAAAWPAPRGAAAWRLHEGPAGLFSHHFRAERVGSA